jgi:hypothetical protein
MERFLSISNDPWALADMIVPDVDSFYFGDPMTRAMAREVYGL